MPTGWYGYCTPMRDPIKRPQDRQRSSKTSRPKPGGTKDMRLKKNRKLRGRKKRK